MGFYVCTRAIVLLIIHLLFSPATYAQLPAITFKDSVFNKYSRNITANNSRYYIISYNGKDCLVLQNAKLIRKITNTSAIIKVDNQKINLTSLSCIEKISPANNNWKLSASLEEKEVDLLKKETERQLFSVTADDIEALLNTLKQRKVPFELVSVYKDAQSAVIKCKTSVLFQQWLPEPGLLFADLYVKPQADVLINGNNRSISSLNLIDYFLPAANGYGITVGIKEKTMDATDIDLQKRVQLSALASNEKDFHATTVSTLVGGAGNSFYSGKGVAWKCSFFPSSFSNLFPDSTEILKQKNVTVQNHSYGTQIQPYYGAEAVSYDVQTAQNNTLLHVFSSGNRGTEAAGSGIFANLAGFGNITGNFKMAKNIITVAAVDTAGNLAAFSSAGPAYDGRLGPQIASLGPNGTSEAAAIVSGAVAVLQQLYKDSNALAVPPASLIKAILFNSADDVYNKGIDYRSGFGLLNIYHAVSCLQQKKYDGSELQQSQVWVKNITVPVQAANLKITLNWTDTAAMVNANKALVNDLDLELVELKSGAVYNPWALSLFPNVDSLKKLPERKRDSLNTAEQVSIELPASGQYQLKVIAKQVQTVNKQSFHIAYNWDTLNTLRFTNPIHPEDININESSNLKIQWKTAIIDTNTTASLFVTFDNAVTWQLIGSGFKIYRQFFNWLLPDTAVTAQFRMNCPFGIFYSLRFVIAPVPRINVDYLCGESLRLSWQKNVLANAYQLYALGDSAFIKPVSIIADTFVVLSRVLNRENIYAVQPILPNGLQASRSIALDVRNQGVNCYYKTLQIKTSGDSVELSLELSFSNAADSITFEKVTAAGVFARFIAKSAVASGDFTYSSFDTAPDRGVNYYRAKLWKGGVFVYTEIVYILHNGNTSLFMYPNPVARGRKINFLVKETIGVSTLQVTDITGRLMGNFPVNSSGFITTGAWSSGIYFYRLIATNKKMTASGKFIIQ